MIYERITELRENEKMKAEDKIVLYYSLIICSTVLFSLQFLFNQKFQKENGTDLKASLTFSLYKSIVAFVIMLIISGFSMSFSPFSIAMAAIYSLSGFLMTYFSLKAFAVANLSVYSVFSMLGGMILPFFLGVAIYNEELNVFKIVCCLLIVCSILLNLKSGNGDRKAIFYYMAVFVLNGMAGVISKIHQSSPLPHANSSEFMALTSLVSILLCGVWLIAAYRKIPLVKGKSLFYVSGYGVFNGVGNLFLLISLAVLPASVQYPLVTGGVMVCSAVISTVRKEKLTKREYLATAVAFLASVLIAL